MKHLLPLLGFGLVTVFPAVAQGLPPVSQADSAYLFSYATSKNNHHNGLHFAWSLDRTTWHEIGPEWAFVKSDYGAWGSQKRMLNPRMLQQADGVWEIVWEVNETDNVLAYTRTSDLVHYKPQDYYAKDAAPVAAFASRAGAYRELHLPSAGRVHGEIHRVAWTLVDGLIRTQQQAERRAALAAERAADDRTGRFRDLQPQQTTIRVSGQNARPMSDKLIGIFFEDINYAADGGLYAELVQNRDFEYNAADHHGWHSLTAWRAEGVDLSVDTADPIHVNNPHYAVLRVMGEGGSIANSGWDGIAVRRGEQYDLSLFGRVAEGKGRKLRASLVTSAGETVASAILTLGNGQKWSQRRLTLRATASADTCRLVLAPLGSGTYHLDMVSLFPRDTYKGRSNGLRRDLAETLEALRPRFVRFPGGCVAHGQGLDNIYRWKNTIGPLEARKPAFNIWHYHQSLGLGFYEYFQMCEDMGARPLPVLAAGVPCQNSSVGGSGQQGGIPMEEMDAYIQDILDLIEWANGDPKTNPWARKRAEAGHPAPFGLEMIGIGNEDLISDVFIERFRMIHRAITERYPEIQVVGTVGPFNEGSDYEEGWRLARELELPYVDEHYYNSPGWFINNQDFYDRYARPETDGQGNVKRRTLVYLGEYASHIPGRANNLETALSEALYLCSIERNADIVAMTSYAPLLARKGHTQWNPDLIYFGNTFVSPTTGYEVQRLFGQNAGTLYLPATTSHSDTRRDITKRVASSITFDARTGEHIVKLVNYLPVANDITLSLPVEEILSTTGELLTGELSDTAAKASSLPEITLSEGHTLGLTLPAYSFAVIRVKSRAL